MRHVLVIFLVVFLVTSCDDGDIITVNIDFDNTLNLCENNSESYIIYNTKQDPGESLTIVFPRNATNDLLFTEPTGEEPIELEVNMSSTRFLYRTYNRNISGDELCATIIPSDLIILENYEAAQGAKIFVTSTIVDDDNDGVPTEFEGADPNGDGDFSDSLDTDNDGIFDYLDDDDDNDNVLTSQELNDDDDDDDPTTNPLDTDDDGILDYLDTDDDNDGVLTILEDANGENGPIDDTVNENGELVPLFRSLLETESFPNPGQRTDNDYTRTVTTSFTVRDFDIEILLQDELFIGNLTTTFIVTLED